MPKDVGYDDDDFEQSRKQAIKDRKEKLEKGVFKLPVGDTVFRILKTPGDKQRSSPPLYINYYVHSGVGPKKRTVRCGKDVYDDSQPCWLCDSVIAKLADKGETKRAEEIRQYKTYGINIAVFETETGEFRGPLFWPMTAGGKRSASWIVEGIITDQKSRKYLDHENGYNYTINRTGMGYKDTAYENRGRDDEPSEVPPQILKRLKPFVDTVLQYDKEEQKRAYYGTTEEEEEEAKVSRKKFKDDEDEEEAPKSRRRPVVEEDEEEEKPRPKKRPAVVEEDEEEEAPKPKKRSVVEEDEDDLNFMDDEKPKRKPPKGEFEDDENELEEKPRRKAKDEFEEEDEFEERSKKKAKDDDDDFDADEEKPKPKKRVVEDDEDEFEEPKPKKRPVVEEDEEEPRPKKRKVVEDEEEEEPRPKKRVVEEDEEEEFQPKRKKVVGR